MFQHVSLLLLTTVLTISATAQEDQMHIRDGRIVYQKVFEGELDNPLEYLENLRGVSNVRNLNGAFFSDGVISNDEVRRGMTDVGMRGGTTPIFLQATNIRCQIQLEKREGRYRVTVTDIMLEWVSPTALTDGDETIDGYVLKRSGAIKPKIFQTTKTLYDQVFLNLFAPPETAPSTDDW